MKAYKGTNHKMQCNGYQFNLTDTFTAEGPLLMCKNGFHCCEQLWHVTYYYPIESSRYWEVEIGDNYIQTTDKICAASIKFLRELSFYEVMRLLNKNEDGSPLQEHQQNTNTGFLNCGNHNLGNCNSGNHNSGNCNSGNYNLGNCNSGNYNSGNYNSGNYNS